MNEKNSKIITLFYKGHLCDVLYFFANNMLGDFMKKFIRVLDGFFAAAIFVFFTIIGIGNYILPGNINTYYDKPISYGNIFTFTLSDDEQVDFQRSRPVSAIEGDIKLFGVIPVKTATLSYNQEQSVAVSGESFGIKLYTDGVIVVGTRDVEGDNGKSNPAKDAGLEKGDIIVSINDIKTTTSDKVEEIFNDNNGKPYKIKVKRNGNYKTFSLTPVYSKSEGSYKVGIWVRDSTAGIGTITFYNPSNSSFAALGHPITDVDTNEIMPILEGEAVEANVTKLYKSSNGEAGSICCDFTNNKIGSLSTNSVSGIYGKYICNTDKCSEYKVAPAQEVEKGQAQIICTLDSSGPQLYTVEIVKVSYRDSQEKNMVIKVVDENLISKTGGIVQGMSGSPIIQNGKLVGALTHVIVDNPEKGYGIFAEKMLEQSNSVV